MSRRIRLLIDAHVFDGEFQGSRTFIEHIYLNFIQKYSDQFEFFLVAQNTQILRDVFGKSENVHFVKLASHNRYNRLLFEYPKIIKNYQIDYAHFQYVAPPIKVCKHIVTTHDVLFERFPQYFPFSYRLSKHFLFSYSARKADILTTVSNYSRDEIAHFYKLDQEQIHVISNGVSLPVNFESSSIDKPYVLYLSRIEPRKNHHKVLDCFKKLRLFEKGYKLVFVGKESIPNPDLKNLISTLGAKEKRQLIFLEGISEAEKNDLIKNCSLFVYPSSAEGFGIPPLEAALLEAPVICSNTTSMSEFSFFKSGHINPDNDSFCQAFESFIENPDKENRKEIAREIQETYNWQNSADKLAKIIIDDFKA